MSLLAVVTLLAAAEPARGQGFLTLVAPSSPSFNLDVGAGYSSSTSSSTSLQVRNDGDQPIQITGYQTAVAASGNVYAEITSGIGSPIGPGTSRFLNLRATAISQNGASTGTFTPTLTIFTNVTALDIQVTMTVKDWRPANPSVPTIGLVQTMPCPRPSGSVPHTFSVPVSNTGDYALTVYSISFGGFPFPVESTSGFGSFVVDDQDTVSRQFRVQTSSFASESTYSGTVTAQTSAGSTSAPFSLQVIHPVEVQLPSIVGTHDFGDVELTQKSANPLRLFLQETCDYKAATVSVAAGLPDYVVVTPNPLVLGPGESRQLEIDVRFGTSHSSLLQREQRFQAQLTNTAGAGATYDLRAKPILIDITQTTQTLQSLAADSPSGPGREAAGRMHTLLVARTQQPPQNQAELEDVARIFTVGEPVALTIGRLQLMLEWNESNQTELTVRDLVAVTAGFDALEGVCSAVTNLADRDECLAILSILRVELQRFAQQARGQFEALAAGVSSDLDLARADAGLALALRALGEDEQAAQLAARAQVHFANFTRSLQEASHRLDRIEARDADASPAVFLRTQTAFVAWHPLSLPLFSAYVADTMEDYRGARAALIQAGDDVRLASVEADQQEFLDTVEASFWVNRLVLAAYLVLLGTLLVLAVYGALQWRGAERLRSLGDFVLPEVWAEKGESIKAAAPRPGR